MTPTTHPTPADLLRPRQRPATRMPAGMSELWRRSRTDPAVMGVQVDVTAADDGDDVTAGEAVRSSRTAATPSAAEGSTTRRGPRCVTRRTRALPSAPRSGRRVEGDVAARAVPVDPSGSHSPRQGAAGARLARSQCAVDPGSSAASPLVPSAPRRRGQAHRPGPADSWPRTTPQSSRPPTSVRARPPMAMMTSRTPDPIWARAESSRAWRGLSGRSGP